jgi:transmembrane sensor
MASNRILVLFQRYIDGSISNDERIEFIDLAGQPENERLIKDLMDELWSTLPEADTSFFNKNENFDRLLKHRKFSRLVPEKRHYFGVFKVAATIAFFTLFGAGLYFYSQRSVMESSLSMDNKSNEASRFIRLPDGSTVILNVGSSLTYPEKFSGENRVVQLSGEAFFDIQHDSAKPFIVTTGDITTTVLGTAFNIKAFPEDQHVTVTVTRGKVKVSSTEKLFGVITRDQRITVQRQTNEAQQSRVDSKAAVAWIERDIHFDNISMLDAITELEDRFDVTISLKNEKLKSCRFTATFVKGEGIEQILLVLSEFNHATYTYDQPSGRIEIDGGSCEL